MTPSMSSTPKCPCDAQEMDYVMRLAPAMQNPVQVSTVRMWSAHAKAVGLDPQRIYETAVAGRPPHWMPAPGISDVLP